MLFFAEDEQDLDLDEEDLDADEDTDSDEEDEDTDDDAGDDDSEDDDESDDDEDNKPVTRKELREMLAGNKNKNNAHRRVSSKKDRVTKQPSDLEKSVAEIKATQDAIALSEKKRSFGYEHNLSPKQVNHVYRLTKRPTEKFLNKPHVKAALDAIKSSENVARNTPSGSGKRGRAPGGKSWTELKPEERQANFADRRASILANKRQ